MEGAPPRRRESPPALPDELIEEIFLRLPPDEPASLRRASLISKAWGRAISSPAFRRRLHEFHRTPPVLGFLHNWAWEPIRFIATTASSFSLAAPDPQTWRALDCRHGRALFLGQGAHELLVWEPITGAQRRVPVPSLFESLRVRMEDTHPGAAVFCAVDGCDHRDCHGGPFKLVFVFTNVPLFDPEDIDEEFDIWACVFASETGTWGRLTPMLSKFAMVFAHHSSVLVASSLLYFMSDRRELILEYDLTRHSMTVLKKPGYSYEGGFNLMLTEDGGLGVAEYSNPELKLWTRDASVVGIYAHWVLSRVINLVDLLPIGALVDAHRREQAVGFVEGTNTIFVNTGAGIFIVELQSEKARKVCDRCGLGNVVPVVSFYTPVPRGEYQDPASLGPSVKASGEEGGEKDKAIEQPQEFFGEGSNAIEEDFVNTRFTHALKTRVPSYREGALECANTEYGCALLYKAQAMNDPWGDVPESASNEESVTGTTSKDDAGNSKTSGSNVEDATPSQKGESKEVLS